MAEEQPMKGITEPGETDVLCGRGGAALRHPGNQTYRRLVNLNKGLYITCLKTEKLKISRSIVAAIREQRGRFLEKDTKTGAWFDIGDKKAIEKTSQALREGQPKLRQKIVEMGGQAAMESQYGHAGIYPEQVGLGASGLGGGDMMQQQHLHQQHQQRQQAAAAAAQAAAMRQQEFRHQVPNPDPARQDIHAEMFQRLSLRDLNASQQQEERMLQHQQRARQMRSGMAQRAGELGMTAESQLSLMSDYSAIGGVPNESMLSMDSSFRRTLASMTTSQYTMDSFGSNGMNSYGHQHQPLHPGSMMPPPHVQQSHHHHQQQQQHHHQQQQQQLQQMSSAQNGRDRDLSNIDRRRVFAKMKYNRPPSALELQEKKMSLNSSSHRGQPGQEASQRSLGDGLPDGMPDIHMVESSLSLYSNLSTMTDGNATKGGLDGFSNHMKGGLDGFSNHKPSSSGGVARPPGVETVKVVDHSRDIHWAGSALGGGSRHSVMSGLSRIDDSLHDGNSIFSDLRKGVNTSTRSMAMSEISAIDMQERDNEDESSDSGFAHGHEGVPVEQRKTQPAMDFDL